MTDDVRKFPGYFSSRLPRARKTGRNLVADHRPVKHVPKAFKRIRTSGDYLAFWDAGRIPKHRYTRINIGRRNRARNHFQGVQRARTGNYLFLTGADATTPASHLFVIEAASCPQTGPWGTNILFQREPLARDRIVKVVALDRTLFHAGGISVIGDILAVPVENDESSRILFLDVKDPTSPKQFDFVIERPDHKASAVALARFRGRFICAVWHQVKRKPRGRIDFYVSTSDDFFDGFDDKFVTWTSLPDGWQDHDRDPTYQAINFVKQTTGRGVDSLYLLGLENESEGAPVFGGPDIADLLRVTVPTGLMKGNFAVGAPKLKWINSKQLRCRDQYCNLDAAGGVHIDHTGALHLYAGYHWRMDHELLFTEFRSDPDAGSDAITDMRDAWVDLFEHPRFEGRRLSVLGTKDSKIPHYGKIFVQGGGFDNKVSSARYQIPAGESYRLYKDKDFKDGQEGVDFLDLNGTGVIAKIPNFKRAPHKFGDKVSSSQFVSI